MHAAGEEIGERAWAEVAERAKDAAKLAATSRMIARATRRAWPAVARATGRVGRLAAALCGSRPDELARMTDWQSVDVAAAHELWDVVRAQVANGARPSPAAELYARACGVRDVVSGRFEVVDSADPALVADTDADIDALVGRLGGAAERVRSAATPADRVAAASVETGRRVWLRQRFAFRRFYREMDTDTWLWWSDGLGPMGQGGAWTVAQLVGPVAPFAETVATVDSLVPVCVGDAVPADDVALTFAPPPPIEVQEVLVDFFVSAVTAPYEVVVGRHLINSGYGLLPGVGRRIFQLDPVETRQRKQARLLSAALAPPAVPPNPAKFNVLGFLC